jgi:WD40 repeat protein
VRAVLAVGDRVVSGGESGAIKVWSIRADKCLKTLRTSTGKTVEALAITSNGRILLAASQSTVQLWDLNDFRCVGLLTGKHSDTVTSMAVAGSYLFTGSADKTIKVWNMTNLEVVASVEGFETWVFSLAVSTEHLYAGSGSLRAFELSALFKGKTKPTAVVERPHDAPSVQTLSVTQDDRFLVSASIDGMLKVWKLELKSKAQPEAAVENRSKFIFSAVVHERRVFTADREGVVKVWE